MLSRLALAAILVAFLAGCAGTAPTSAHDALLVQGLSVGGAGQHGDQFEPKSLTVKVGSAVTFRMAEGSPHTVEFQDTAGVSSPKSGNLNPGDETKVTFAQAGTFRYFCAYHSSVGGSGMREGMVGSITVA
ncbi:MAG: plastocyanin/azurin family copper-binding protein [Candidatus Thermoplasmatota archaeon]